ncbi:MAG: hypothetical protein GYB67_14060 [Chloroflexi bacterium]|nr:hypothetical protein [Chloroflexota bacterium]
MPLLRFSGLMRLVLAIWLLVMTPLALTLGISQLFPARDVISMPIVRAHQVDFALMDISHQFTRTVVHNVEMLSAPQWSPDGTRIAYLGRSPRAGVDIFVTHVYTGTVTNVSDSPGIDYDPAWSPDSNQIAFATRDFGSLDIFRVNADGSDRQRLTHGPDEDFDPIWSPDGRQIVFRSDRNRGVHIFLMDADGGNQRLLSDRVNLKLPQWSPDSTQLLIGHDHDVFLINASTNDELCLTLDNTLLASDPVWSPDGRQIAYIGVRNHTQHDIYIMNVDGSNNRRLTTSGDVNAPLNWSPDGSHLVFQRHPMGERSEHVYILSLTADGQTHSNELLVRNFDQWVMWQP